jgi:hypothetical protein
VQHSLVAEHADDAHTFRDYNESRGRNPEEKLSRKHNPLFTTVSGKE